MWAAVAVPFVVLMVSVAVTGCDPEIAAGWETVHAGGFGEPDGPPVMAQASCTAPVNPPLGVTVTVVVVDEPTETAEAALLETVKLGFPG